MERLNDILREATEQSGGIHIPTLLFAQSIPDDLEGAIIAHTLDGGQSLSSTQLQDLYTLVIGPEGGWSNTEITHMQSLGACTTKCGTRILRTETAGVVIAFYLRNRG